MDLIDRKQTIDLLLAEGMITAAVYVERMPSAEKTGRNLRADTPSLFECSVCGWSCLDTLMGDSEYKYCPNCGARMVDDEH